MQQRTFFHPQFCGYQTEVNIFSLWFRITLLMYLGGLVYRYIIIQLSPVDIRLRWISLQIVGLTPNRMTQSHIFILTLYYHSLLPCSIDEFF